MSKKIPPLLIISNVKKVISNLTKLVIASVLFLPVTLLAEPATYNESNRRLAVACVDPQINGVTALRKKDDAPKTHKLTFQLSADFTTANVIAGSRVAKTEECTAVFNLATGVLSGEVMFDGESQPVSLLFTSGLAFSVLEFPLPLPSVQTSLWRVINGDNEVFVAGVFNYSLSDFFPLAFGFTGVDILRESDYPLPTQFEEAYQMSDQIITRAVPSQVSSGALTLQGLALNTQSALVNDIDADLYDELATYMQDALELDVGGLPFRAHWLADLIKILTAVNSGYVSGMETHFQTLATTDKKTNFGLEAADDQMFAYNLNNLNADKTAQITAALAEVKSEDFIENVDALINAWRNGDDSVLYNALVKQDREGDLNNFTRFYTERYETWLGVFDDMLDSELKEFVIIDIRYLVGADSLLAFLEEQGYTVERY